MTARAIIAPLSFGDSSLPRININYTRPIAGALYDWAVNQVPDGPIFQWASLIDGAKLITDGTAPVASGAGKARAIRFDGTSSRMRAAFNLSGARTVIAVYRFVATKANDQVWYGATADTGLGIDSASTTVRVSSTSKFLIPKPAILPDTAWHIAAVTVNGASSAFRQDDAETVGDLTGAAAMEGLTLGFGGGTAYRASIEYKRIAIVPGAMTAAQRGLVVDQMRAEYF